MLVIWFIKVFVLILILTLFIAMLILFVPVQYRLNADYNEKLDILIKAAWFLRIITITYDSGKSPSFRLRIFGIVGKNKTKPKNTQTDSEKSKKRKRIKHPKEKDENPDKEDIKDKKKNNFFRKISFLMDKLIKIFDYPYKTLLINRTSKLLKRLIKAFIIKNADVECDFGFDDPSKTGMLLGAAHALCGITHSYKYVRINADFEKEYLYLKSYMEGKFTIWSLFWPLVAYVVNKPVWILLKPYFFTKKRKDEK